MPPKREMTVSGVMTGNSLDAVDVATYRVALTGDTVTEFAQIAFHSSPLTATLRDETLTLKEMLAHSSGKLTAESRTLLDTVSRHYHSEVTTALSDAQRALHAATGRNVDLLGVHGQTLGHCPPSMAASGQRPYTVQLGDGGAIADQQGVVTVADFRSDDLLNGGEGAPFAPAFNALLLPTLHLKEAVFINGGNTSNIAFVRSDPLEVIGWDCGPCNHFTDLLMREEGGAPIDRDGHRATQGKVIPRFIELLWRRSVLRSDGGNALELTPPRSFDPQWYRLPSSAEFSEAPFNDRIRSVVAFSAYCIAHSLALVAMQGGAPEAVLLFGGGFKNPVLLNELKDLCAGRASYVLPEHQELFAAIRRTLPHLDTVMKRCDELGLSSDGMEAGIFAFAAVQRILNKPFTHPRITNCRTPTRCGAVFLPTSGVRSQVLSDLALHDERSLFRDPRLGRASPDQQP